MNAILATPQIVERKQEGADGLFSTLYSELHRLARRELNRRGRIGGLGVTTLLHEAYLSISGTEGTVFVDHARFMAYAARVMRSLIIDDVRRRRSEKRGGLYDIQSLDLDHADSVTQLAGGAVCAAERAASRRGGRAIIQQHAERIHVARRRLAATWIRSSRRR